MGPAGPSGTAAITQVEIDFGSSPTESMAFTVTDGTVTSGAKIVATHAYVAATGRSLDENELDQLVILGTGGAGSVSLFVVSLFGPVVGKYVINYIVG